ncbi:MAG TPA: cob(I)yrinic acid a,c-diamide adenosyltransferase [Myxococcota bacterium]|jgi:cob(I)alamin adenosyltransferase|nr:cob(I)yrinic acid a,c-diamide adenosyltransferase [Myxococcota bacterium]
MVRLTRIYTRTGDAGATRLVGGREIAKDSPRIDAYGTVDELNAAVGLVRMEIARHPLGATLHGMDASLQRIQQELFNLGSDLATLVEDRYKGQPVIEPHHIEALEHEMDALNEALPELASFVLPGGGPVGASLHLARTICRRAERVVVQLGREEVLGLHVVPYLNRLSDALFVFSREAARATGEPEPLWEPERT